MFTADGILYLHRLTHERLDTVLDHAASLPPGLFTRELAGFGFPSLRDQLVHMLSVEAGWVRALQDLPSANLAPDAFPDVEAVRLKKHSVFADTVAYIRSLSPERLNAALPSRPREWSGPLESPAFILHHVLTHAFHHKGQLVAMFRQLGFPAPDTDLQREG
jgi:uncharacterized damage-inducible protein DinB